MTASTCQSSMSLSSHISIYSGDCDGSLYCEEVTETRCGSRSSVAWAATANQQYYIFIQISSDVKDFTLYVEEASPNDVCSHATGPLSRDYSPTFGSTRSATIEMIVGLQKQGIWYSVVGTGEEITATTCAGSTNFNTALLVFKGDCESLTQVETKGISCDNRFGSTVYWDSSAGELYHLLVTGDDLSQYGNFVLSIAGNPKGVCVGAGEPIQIGSSPNQGSTIGAIFEKYFNPCITSIDYPGAWFSVIGTGEPITASTCNDGTDFETRISIFKGACDDLKCAASEVIDAEPTIDSSICETVTWLPTIGDRYYILVHGIGAGNFELSLN